MMCEFCGDEKVPLYEIMESIFLCIECCRWCGIKYDINGKDLDDE